MYVPVIVIVHINFIEFYRVLHSPNKVAQGVVDVVEEEEVSSLPRVGGREVEAVKKKHQIPNRLRRMTKSEEPCTRTYMKVIFLCTPQTRLYT